jgi:hypothetical protein
MSGDHGESAAAARCDGGCGLFADTDGHWWHGCLHLRGVRRHAARGADALDHGRAQRHADDGQWSGSERDDPRHGPLRLPGHTGVCVEGVPGGDGEPDLAGQWHGGHGLLADAERERRSGGLHVCGDERFAANGIEPEHEHGRGERDADSGWQQHGDGDSDRCERMPRKPRLHGDDELPCDHGEPDVAGKRDDRAGLSLDDIHGHGAAREPTLTRCPRAPCRRDSP